MKRTKTWQVIAVAALLLLAGCSEFSNGDENVTVTPDDTTPDKTPDRPTPTRTATPDPTPTPTPTPGPTPTPASTATPEPTKAEKFAAYAEDYKRYLNKSDVNNPKTRVDVPNNTVHVTAYIENASDKNSAYAIQDLLLSQSVLVGDYMDPPKDMDISLSWVPMYLNTTVKVRGEGVVHTSFITKFSAMDYHTGKISWGEYRWQYFGNLDLGPANPYYDGNNSTQS